MSFATKKSAFTARQVAEFIQKIHGTDLGDSTTFEIVQISSVVDEHVSPATLWEVKYAFHLYSKDGERIIHTTEITDFLVEAVFNDIAHLWPVVFERQEI